MRKVAMVLPTSNNLPWLEETINSILDNTYYEHYRIIIIESESTDGTAEYTNYLAKKYDKIEVHHTKKMGSIKAVNLGIMKTMKDEDVFLIQDDVVIPRLVARGWLTEMTETAEKENVGIITTLNGGGTSGPEYLKGLFWVGTWSMYICRRTIEQVGLFDDEMKIGEDVDYAYRVQKAGLDVRVLNLWFEHHMQRSTPHADQSQEVIKEASKYFKKKYGIKEKV